MVLYIFSCVRNKDIIVYLDVEGNELMTASSNIYCMIQSISCSTIKCNVKCGQEVEND